MYVNYSGIESRIVVTGHLLKRSLDADLIFMMFHTTKWYVSSQKSTVNMVSGGSIILKGAHLGDAWYEMNRLIEITLNATST